MFEKTPLTGISSNASNDVDVHFNCPESSKPPYEASYRRERSVQGPLKRSMWLDSWSLEWTALTFSIACFIAILIVLWIYDGKLRPEMASGLSLNTIISVLATACKSALILVIAEAISQLKWLHFEWPAKSAGQGQLVSIQRFDAASRGPLGSLMIIFHHRARSLASVGAVVIVLLLVFDPFMQQVLTYPLIPTSVSSTVAGPVYPQLRGYLPDDNADDTMQNAIMDGYFSSQNFKITPQCSSGNCTWPRFQSVGVCSRCSNLTSDAIMNCELPTPTKNFNKTCDISFSGDARLKFNVSLDMSSTQAVFELPDKFIWQPVSLKGGWKSGYVTRHANSSPEPIEDVRVVNLPNQTLAGVKDSIATFAYAELGMRDEELRRDTSISHYLYLKNLTGCSLSMCLKDYQISVENGIPSIKTQDLGFGAIDLKYPGRATPKGEFAMQANPLCWSPSMINATHLQDAEKFAFCDSNMYYIKNHVEQYLPPIEVSSWWFTPAFYQQSWTGGRDGNGMERISRDRLERIGFERSLANIAASLTKFGLGDQTTVFMVQRE